jgi:hypothetical protein
VFPDWVLIGNDFRRTDAEEERDEARHGFALRSEKWTGREQNPHEFYYLLKLGGYTSGATSVNSIE